MTETAVPAINKFVLSAYKLRSELMPNGKVIKSRLLTTRRGHKKLFHAPINVNVPKVASAGLTRGTTIRQ